MIEWNYNQTIRISAKHTYRKQHTAAGVIHRLRYHWLQTEFLSKLQEPNHMLDIQVPRVEDALCRDVNITLQRKLVNKHEPPELVGKFMLAQLHVFEAVNEFGHVQQYLDKRISVCCMKLFLLDETSYYRDEFLWKSSIGSPANVPFRREFPLESVPLIEMLL